MINTLIFDLGGVLYTNGTKQFISYLTKRYHLPKTVVQNTIDGDIGSQYREGKISRDIFWEQVRERLNLLEDTNTLEQLWINEYVLNEEVENLITRLSPTYNIFYLSDNVKERVDALDGRYHFLALFQGGIFSHEAGVRKPNPIIYQKALALTKSRPDETVYVDDKAPFLLPAKKLGMHVVQFTSFEVLKEDLTKLGVDTN